MAEDWKLALAEFKDENTKAKEENTKIIFCLKQTINKIEFSIDTITGMMQSQLEMEKITQQHMEQIIERDAVQTEKISQLEIREDKQDDEIKDLKKDIDDGIKDIKEVKIPEVKKSFSRKLKPLYKGYYGIIAILLVLLTGLCLTDNPIFSKIIGPVLKLFLN